jgi:hypothetical protein
MELTIETEYRQQFLELPLDENIQLYREYYNKALYKTIYHHPDYLLAEEKAEDYRIYLYILDNKENFIILPSVKRRINDIDVFQDLTDEYYDLITPHEYSGVIAGNYNESGITDFYMQLELFCRNNNIIFSFIRFNPYRDENKIVKNFNVKLTDEQNWVDCTEDVLQHFQKRKARYVRSAITKGLQCIEVDKNKANIEEFFIYYQKAMERLQAKKFLYFNFEYFDMLCKCEFTKLFFVFDCEKNVIYSGIIVLCDEKHKKMYHHLSFRNIDADDIHAMEYMIYATSEWAKSNKYESMHLGGGDEQLHGFKDKCTDKRVDYYVGYKIMNNDSYQYLCDMFCQKYPEMKENSYLPLYRCRE